MTDPIPTDKVRADVQNHPINIALGRNPQEFELTVAAAWSLYDDLDTALTELDEPTDRTDPVSTQPAETGRVDRSNETVLTEHAAMGSSAVEIVVRDRNASDARGVRNEIMQMLVTHLAGFTADRWEPED